MKAIKNLVGIFSCGLVVSAGLIIAECADEMTVLPERWSMRIGEMANLSERPITEVSSLGNSLRKDIVRETNQIHRIEILRRCCVVTLKMPIDRRSARRHVDSLEAFLALAESEYYTFWDVAADRELAWEFLLKVLARYAKEVEVADSHLQAVISRQGGGIQTVQDQKAISDARFVARSLHDRYQYLIRKYLDLAELKNDYQRLSETSRKRLVEKVKSIVGRYPEWYKTEQPVSY